jgi:alkylated DNA repair protein alkB family protein 8
MTTYVEPTKVDGLTIIEDFISENEEKELLNYLDSNNSWKEEITARRTQQFGYTYDYATLKISRSETEIPNEIQYFVSKMQELGFYENNSCEQIIVNEYTNDQGIGKHTDAPCFGDTVASLSLSDPTIMLFHEYERKKATGRVCAVTLKPRSLIVLQRDARYIWAHEIPKKQEVEANGVTCIRSPDFRRVSVTFRKVVH